MTTQENGVVENGNVEVAGNVASEKPMLYAMETTFNYNRLLANNSKFAASKAEFIEKKIPFSEASENELLEKIKNEKGELVDNPDYTGEYIKLDARKLAVSFDLDLSDRKIFTALLQTFVNHVVKRNESLQSRVKDGELSELVIDADTFADLTKKATSAAAAKVTAEMVIDAIGTVFANIETFSNLAQAADAGDKKSETIVKLIVEILEGKATPARCKSSQLPLSLKKTIALRLKELTASVDDNGDKVVTDEDNLAVFEVWEINFEKHFTELEVAAKMENLVL